MQSVGVLVMVIAAPGPDHPGGCRPGGDAMALSVHLAPDHPVARRQVFRRPAEPDGGPGPCDQYFDGAPGHEVGRDVRRGGQGDHPDGHRLAELLGGEEHRLQPDHSTPMWLTPVDYMLWFWQAGGLELCTNSTANSAWSGIPTRYGA